MGLFGKGNKKETAMKMEPSAMKDTKETAQKQMVKDPVCGMVIDAKTAPARSEYMGKTYYFCSSACKKAFDANPAKYAGEGVHGMAGHGEHKM